MHKHNMLSYSLLRYTQLEYFKSRNFHVIKLLLYDSAYENISTTKISGIYGILWDAFACMLCYEWCDLTDHSAVENVIKLFFITRRLTTS